MKVNKRDKHKHNHPGAKNQTTHATPAPTIPKTKEELFKKYSIDESHSKYEAIDSWMGVEIFRVMHGGALPTENDTSAKYITDFLDNVKEVRGFAAELMRTRDDFGSLFLTAKRSVYMLHEEILKELNA